MKIVCLNINLRQDDILEGRNLLMICVLFVVVCSCCCLWLELDVCHDAVSFVVVSFAAQKQHVFVQRPLDSRL